MFRQATFLLSTILALVAWQAAAAEKVVLRAANGRFLRVTESGVLRAESALPADKETFELVSRGKQRIALKGPGGRWLVADARDGCTPRVETASAAPGDRETFQLVTVGKDRFSLLRPGSDVLLCFDPADTRPPDPKTPAAPAPSETVEIYRLRELPSVVQVALPAAVRTLASEELAHKQYDKTRSHKTEKYVDLPSPTLKELTRKKRHQVLGVTEEYRVQAQLDGPADIRVPAMPFLANYADGGSSLMLFALEASLPIGGRVQCKMPDVASASTGYIATVGISAVSEIRVQRSGGDVKFESPAVLDLHLSISKLRLSNDLLDATRRQIENLVNHELRHNEDRIREKANQSIQKAMTTRDVRIPLLGYLMLP